MKKLILLVLYVNILVFIDKKIIKRIEDIIPKIFTRYISAQNTTCFCKDTFSVYTIIDIYVIIVDNECIYWNM